MNGTNMAAMASHVDDGENASTTLFVKDLPLNISKESLEEIFSEVGPLKRCFIVTERDSKKTPKGFGYVTFALREDAQSAIERIKTINGKRIQAKFAKKRGRDGKKPLKEETEAAKRDGIKIKKEVKEKKEKKGIRANRKEKNARLIVRNLSFKATEEDVRKSFKKFGKIVEIILLTKRDGKRIGCGFVQFSDIKEAAAALQEMNAKEILGRPVAVDWALPKNKFLTLNLVKENVDDEMQMKTEDDMKMEKDDDVDGKYNKNVDKGFANVRIKKEKGDEDEKEEEEEESESEDDSSEETDEDEDSSENDDSVESESDDEENDQDESDDEDEDEETNSNIKHLKNDVNEGRTLFLRDLTFDATESDIKKTLGKFGPIKYAVICIDEETEHPRGTAFVQFVNKADAAKCLETAVDESKEGGIVIDGRRINVNIALSREEMLRRNEERRKKIPRDVRNIYLAREGLIKPDSKAAEGVSASDMAKRKKVEEWKQQMLKNLNVFISKTRLCIRNLPPTLTDDKLKRVFLKYAGNGATIIEARIIRTIKPVDKKTLGESKGYGFVNFKTHEHALKALRGINNNPEIFSNEHRPIVEFSLEKKGAMKAKEKRIAQSRAKLNLPQKEKLDKQRHESLTSSKEKRQQLSNSGDPSFVGAKGIPGSKRILPSLNPRASKLKMMRKKRPKKHDNRKKQIKKLKKA